MKVEWDAEDGVPDEEDLWKFFSDHPDKPSDTILHFDEIKPLLTKMRLKDETRLYHVYRHWSIPMPPEGASPRAVVTQRNLCNVASAISGSGSQYTAAIQYLGKRA